MHQTQMATAELRRFTQPYDWSGVDAIVHEDGGKVRNLDS